MTDRQTKPLNSSWFLEILRTNFQEQISRLEIRELNLIPTSRSMFPKTETGKLRSLLQTTINFGKMTNVLRWAPLNGIALGPS